MVSSYVAKILSTMITLTLVVGVLTKGLDDATLLENGRTAQKLNAAYQTLKANDGTKACILGNVASCKKGSWVIGQGACSKNQACFALPSNQKIGTFVTCTTENNALSAIEATGATGGIFGYPTIKHDSMSSPITTASTTRGHETAHKSYKDASPDCNDAPLSTTGPSRMTMTTSTRTRTKDSPQTTIEPSTTSLRVMTLTMTIGEEPTTLVPITSTLSPEQASSLLLQLLTSGATIIDGPSASAISLSPKSSNPPPGFILSN